MRARAYRFTIGHYKVDTAFFRALWTEPDDWMAITATDDGRCHPLYGGNIKLIFLCPTIECHSAAWCIRSISHRIQYVRRWRSSIGAYNIDKQVHAALYIVW